MQSLLAAHPSICSLPETHFFPNIVAGGWRRILGLTSPYASETAAKFIKSIDPSYEENLGALCGIFVRDYAQFFISALDQFAASQGRTIWVEKTPAHLHFIGTIEKYVVGVKFIHVIRNGRDVVASLYDATNRYSDHWGGPRSIEECVQRWNNDIAISEKLKDSPEHSLVKYEEVIRHPASTLARICNFIGIGFNESMITNHAQSAESLILEGQEWIEGARGPIREPQASKFERLFTQRQREWILTHLEPKLGYSWAV